MHTVGGYNGSSPKNYVLIAKEKQGVTIVSIKNSLSAQNVKKMDGGSNCMKRH